MFSGKYTLLYGVFLFLFPVISAIPVSPVLAEKGAGTCRPAKHSGSILFSTYKNHSWQIWSIDPDGKNLRQVLQTKSDLHYPQKSPVSDDIACATNERQILILKAHTPPIKPVNIPENCNHPAWSPDGTSIAMVCYTFINRQEDSDIWLYNLFGKSSHKLTSRNNIQSYPTFSPKGNKIAYISGYRVNSSKVREAVWLANADGSHADALLDDGYYNLQPDWSPDGSRLAYASNKSGNMDIWVMDIKSKKATQLTTDKGYDGDPSWSPDGTEICFVSTRSGRMELWIADSNGNNPRQITGLQGESGESMQPSWHN